MTGDYYPWMDQKTIFIDMLVVALANGLGVRWPFGKEFILCDVCGQA